ncbi:MAG: sugar ABC transporter permease YjfF [Clostridia bacterium]|nr:sugar ABC transporter permease YjfF [Clostridia bacterium]
MNLKNVLLVATISLFVVMYAIGSILYPSFLSLDVFLNLFIDNSFLMVTAVGMTFAILSGGIDLSVGSVIGLTTMVSAHLLEKAHMNPFLVMAIVLVMGASFGTLMGMMIHFFKLHPFIVTLGGLFLARGLCYVISTDTINITNEVYSSIASFRFYLTETAFINVNVILFILITILGVYLAHYTKFGRTVYAIGGNEQSAILMGLPVGRTKVLIYTFSGFCSALSGIIFTFYMLSGYALHAKAMETDAIAAAVIGGTLLTGGYGYIIGTMFGVLILGTFQTLIMFQGTLSAWWTRIVYGVLVLIFCLFQQVFEANKGKIKLETQDEDKKDTGTGTKTEPATVDKGEPVSA